MPVSLKVLVWCLLLGLSACSPFYTRHYTKGVFYEGMAHKPDAKPFLKMKTTASWIDRAADTVHMCIQEKTSDTKTPLKEKTRSWIPSGKKPGSVTQKCMTGSQASSPALKKTIYHFRQKQIRSKHSNSSAGEAFLYILALVLALGIIALAIYFLPAILIPSAILSTFMSAVLIAAVIVLLLFAFLVYVLIKLLIDLFKHRKLRDEEYF